MYKYKIETHLHTQYSSKCGWLDAKTLAEGYKAAGYDAVIVTDHYNRTTFDHLGVNLHAGIDMVEAFLTGFRHMVEAGEQVGLRVFRGAELRFDESDNDYLLYGWRDELLADPESIFAMGIAAFSPIARGQGALLVQAHPYRKKNTPAIARYLDGVEVQNLNPRHESHNDQALEYARQFGLLGLAGSDCHRMEDIGVTGILTEELPSDSFGMMRLIRSRNFRLMD